MKNTLKKIANKFGYDIKKIKQEDYFPREATNFDREIINEILDLNNSKKNKLSMVSPQCLWAAIASTKYVIENDIPGDIVECGVWKGGCSIAMAKTLEKFGSNKKIWMYDTFAGMTVPTKYDKHQSTGVNAMKKFIKLSKTNYNDWCFSSLEDVSENLSKFGISNKTKLIKGDVCITLKEEKNLPPIISLLRLDTDWYESTKKELEILYPRLSINGAMLIDDYGHWSGSKKAVDEYFTKNKILFGKPLLWVSDYAGRGMIKSKF